MVEKPTQVEPVREGVEVETPERKTIVLKEPFRRNLKYPGLTISIVIDEENLTLVEPAERVRSRSGAHGEDIYVIDRPVIVLRYSKSNSGKVKWRVYEVTPTTERKLKYRDLPTPYRKAIESYAEYHGIKLNIWEEGEGDEDD